MALAIPRLIRRVERRWLAHPSVLVWVLSLGWLIPGCDQPWKNLGTSPGATPTAVGPGSAWDEQPTVHAQGTLAPAGGVLRLMGTPGDRIEQVLVEPDQVVRAGEPLVQLASERARQQELRLMDERIAEAEQAAELQIAEADETIDRASRAVQQAELAQRHAAEQAAIVRQGQSTVQTARRPLQRLEQAAQEPATRTLVSPADLDRQRLTVEQAEQQWRLSSLTAQQASEAAEMAVQAARQQLAAAQQMRERLNRSRGLEILRQQRVLLETQIDLAQLVAPIDGVVLRVEATAGDSVRQTPLVELADLTQIHCYAEVHEADAPRIELGSAAQMRSAALQQPLVGRVVRIDPVVGSPQLRSPSPLAPVDFRAVGVIILLDDASAELAARWIQLQVDVTIQTPASTTPLPQSPNSEPQQRDESAGEALSALSHTKNPRRVLGAAL
jgi:HlyD family secretion protein